MSRQVSLTDHQRLAFDFAQVFDSEAQTRRATLSSIEGYASEVTLRPLLAAVWTFLNVTFRKAKLYVPIAQLPKHPYYITKNLKSQITNPKQIQISRLKILNCFWIWSI